MVNTICLLVLLIIHKTPVAITMDNNMEIHPSLYGRHQGKMWYFHSTVIFPEEEYKNNIGVNEDQLSLSQVLKVVLTKSETGKLMSNIDSSQEENKLMVRLQVLYVKQDSHTIETNNMKILTQLENNKARNINNKQINSHSGANNENQKKTANANLQKLSDVELNSKLQFINKKLKKRDVNKQKSLIHDLTMSTRSSEEKSNFNDKLFRDLLTIGDPLPPVDLDLGVHTT